MCQEGFKGLACDTQLLNIIVKTQLMKWGNNQPKEDTQALWPTEPTMHLVQTHCSMMVLVDCGDPLSFGEPEHPFLFLRAHRLKTGGHGFALLLWSQKLGELMFSFSPAPGKGRGLAMTQAQLTCFRLILEQE